MGSFGMPLFRLVGALLVAAILLAIPFGTQRGPSPVFAQTPTPATITGIGGSATGASSATVTVHLNNPDGETVTVYLQYGVGGSYDNEDSDSTDSTQIQFNLTGLSQGTVYGIRAGLDNVAPFDATGTVTTGTPSISTVAHSEVDDDSAKITVTVANPNGNTVNMRYKKTADPDPVNVGDTDPYQTVTAQTTTETDDSQALVFSLSGLDDSTGYTVQAKLDSSDFSMGTIASDTFMTTAPPPAISDIAVPDANRLHTSAKIVISVDNVASAGTPVYYQHKKNSETVWPTDTPPSVNATTADLSPEATLSGLDPNTVYNVRASLVSDLSSGFVTQNFTTRRTPSVDSVSVGMIAHGTAKATVSLSNAFNTTVYARHKVKSAADDTYPDPAPSDTTSASSIDFNLGSLSPGVEYTVQSSLVSNFASGIQSETFTTPSIDSVAISGETHKGATATVAVDDMTSATSDATKLQ